MGTALSRLESTLSANRRLKEEKKLSGISVRSFSPRYKVLRVVRRWLSWAWVRPREEISAISLLEVNQMGYDTETLV